MPLSFFISRLVQPCSGNRYRQSMHGTLIYSRSDSCLDISSRWRHLSVNLGILKVVARLFQRASVGYFQQLLFPLTLLSDI